VALEDPGYSGVLDLVPALGLLVEPVAVDDSGAMPRDVSRALRAGARALVLTPRAQNPTGAAFDPARVRELGAILDQHPDTLVIEDDHAGSVAGAPALSLVTGHRGPWALVRSVSKSLGPDLRLAFLAGDATTVARVEGRQQLGCGWVSHILQATVAALWAAKRTERLLHEATRCYTERRLALLGALREAGVAAHGRSGFNVWVPVNEELRTLQALAERGWQVRGGERYRIKSPPAIRITIARLEPRDAPRLADDVRRSMLPESTHSRTA
jgi:DNA-binding transcriptional MocR family regulator